jgi:hypothetical protein
MDQPPAEIRARRRVICPRHERQRQQHGDKDRENLGNENQRHFLNLGERLEQRDSDADGKADEHQRARDEDEGQNRVARDIEHFRSGHPASWPRQIGIFMISS